jgi:hypothetical protein
VTVRTSTYFQAALINTLRGTAYSVPTLYLALHSADPGQTGASELNGGTYARLVIMLTAPSNGLSTNTASLAFNVPANGTVAYLGLWDSLTAGNYLDGGQLTDAQNNPLSVTYGAGGGIFTVPAGLLTVKDNTL